MEHVDSSGIFLRQINYINIASTFNEYKVSLGTLSSYYYFYYDNLSATSNDYFELLLYALAVVLAIVCGSLFIFHACVILFTRYYLYSSTPPQLLTPPLPPASSVSKKESSSAPGVSIIKPLTGVDANICVNLESFFRLDYAEYELLFCVSDPDDPVCAVVNKLIQKYADVQAHLLISSSQEAGVNPKINNMNAAFQTTRYDLVLISDVGIFMQPDTLADMVDTMLSEEPRVGLVHQVPFLYPYELSQAAVRALDADLLAANPKQEVVVLEVNEEEEESISLPPPPIGWLLQMIYFGCWHAKMYMGAAMLGVNCTTGMSCLMRKDVLMAAGGLAHFGRYLAEDFFISKEFYDNGWLVRVAHQPAWQNSTVPSVGQFYSRLIRWYQLRFAMVPLACLLEPFTECIPNGILHAASFAYLFPRHVDPVAFFFCHLLIWFLLDFVLLHQMVHPTSLAGVNKVYFLAMWAFYECTAIFLQLRAVFSRQVEWRNKRYRIRWGGVAERVPNTTLSL